MKKFLLGSVGLAAMLAGPAMAADMPVSTASSAGGRTTIGLAPISASTPAATWSHVDQTFPNRRARRHRTGSRNNFSTSPSDGIFGFHAGAQWQWGAWVLGAEAALSGCFNECRSTSGHLSSTGLAANTFFAAQDHQPVHGGPADWAMPGIAWMIFATGGYASADLKTRGLLDSHRSLRPNQILQT